VQNETTMVTDPVPGKKNRNLFVESDRLNSLRVPQDDRLHRIATAIEAAMNTGKTKEVLQVSREFLDTAADFYQVKQCDLRVLAARPLREPVVQYGPFVMNTREEIEQALADYRDGRLADAA